MQQLLRSLGPGVGCSDERAGLGADHVAEAGVVLGHDRGIGDVSAGADDSGTGGAVLDHVRWQT